MFTKNKVCTYCECDPCCCHTTCNTPAVCIPKPPQKPSSPAISVEGILELINQKCDKETCEIHQLEIAFLYMLLGIDKPDTKPKPEQPLPKPPTDTVKAFQLISNMVDKLDGDLKGKYPSAELLKHELMELWRCMSNKQVHHGEWKDNWVWRDVVNSDMQCATENGKDIAPDKIKVRIPLNAGDVVFYTNPKTGKRCLYESLVDKNVTEPTELNVLDGKWLNYCEIKDAIQCLFPKIKITDCKEKCDDPTGEGIVRQKTLCERLDELEKLVHKLHP